MLIEESSRIGIAYCIVEGGLENLFNEIKSKLEKLMNIKKEDITGLINEFIDNKLWFDYHYYLPPYVFDVYLELILNITSNNNIMLINYWNSIIDNYPSLFQNYFCGMNGETSFIFTYLDKVIFYALFSS